MIICDRCKKDISSYSKGRNIELTIEVPYGDNKRLHGKFDLCKECFEKYQGQLEYFQDKFIMEYEKQYENIPK